MAAPQHAEVEALRAELAALRREVEELRAHAAREPAAPPVRGGVLPRRQLLRAAGAAAAGGVAASMVAAPPAVAANGDPLVLGQSNSATAQTTLDAGTTELVLDVRTNHDDGTAVRAVATALFGDNVGILGASNSATGTGALGYVDDLSGRNTGVCGRSDSIAGTGVLGQAQHVHGITYGVRGETNSAHGYGVYSQGRAKVDGDLVVTGDTRLRNVRLRPSGRPAEGAAGELVVDRHNRLWFCRGGSAWVRLA